MDQSLETPGKENQGRVGHLYLQDHHMGPGHPLPPPHPPAGYEGISEPAAKTSQSGAEPCAAEAEPASEEVSRWLQQPTWHISSAPGTTTERHTH